MRRWINEDNLPEASAGPLGLHNSRQHGAALAGLITPAGQQEKRLLGIDSDEKKGGSGRRR
jgi:hypothetical protein